MEDESFTYFITELKMSYTKLGRGKKYTKEFFRKEMFEHYGNNIDTSNSIFYSIKRPLSVYCKKHSTEVIDTPYKFFTSFCCPFCHEEDVLAEKTKNFIKEANKVHNSKYVYNEVVYKNSKTKVQIICKKHGSFHQSPEGHLSGKGCSKCAREITLSFRRLTRDDFIERSNLVHDNYYDYSLVDYKNNSTNVKIICPKHGVFEQMPVCHLNMSHGCQECAREIASPSEAKIKKWLISNNINFNTQVWFNECRGKKRPLPFDFAIYKNKEIRLLIEFDGVHHFKEFKHFGGKKAFEERKRIDNIKDKFCENKNISLLRIPYWDFGKFDKLIEDKLGETDCI